MRLSWVAWCVCASIWVLWPTRANAQDIDFWEASIDPTIAEAAPLIHSIRVALASPPQHVQIDQVLRQSDDALAIRPHDPLLHHLRGQIFYRLERFVESAQAYRRSLSIAPNGPLVHETSFELGVVLTRLGQFEQARECYVAFIAEWPGRWQRAIAQTNMAETLMALDRLDEAVAAYRVAISVNPLYNHAYFGIAVALDRLGHDQEAQDTMLSGLATGAGMSDLTAEGVFFMPAWEIEYYLGLAYEVSGNPEAARTHWQAFLDGGGDAGPYAERARQHLDALPQSEEPS